MPLHMAVATPCTLNPEPYTPDLKPQTPTPPTLNPTLCVQMPLEMAVATVASCRGGVPKFKPHEAIQSIVWGQVDV